MAETNDEEHGGKFLSKLFWSVTAIPIIMWLWPSVVPFAFFEFWQPRGTVGEWLFSAWPILAWAVGISFVHGAFTRNDRALNRRAEVLITEGLRVSTVAGVVEEITFRWLFFFTSIVSVKVASFFFFGFLGFGIPEWLHLNLFGPLANWATFGGLESYIFHPSGWGVGAGMIAANGFFRDGHRYQGFLGWINSWCMGMYLFWIMFNYGLPAAIIVHFTYDFLIYLVRYADAFVERALGYA